MIKFPIYIYAPKRDGDNVVYNNSLTEVQKCKLTHVIEADGIYAGAGIERTEKTNRVLTFASKPLWITAYLDDARVCIEDKTICTVVIVHLERAVGPVAAANGTDSANGAILWPQTGITHSNVQLILGAGWLYCVKEYEIISHEMRVMSTWRAFDARAVCDTRARRPVAICHAEPVNYSNEMLTCTDGSTVRVSGHLRAWLRQLGIVVLCSLWMYLLLQYCC